MLDINIIQVGHIVAVHQSVAAARQHVASRSTCESTPTSIESVCVEGLFKEATDIRMGHGGNRGEIYGGAVSKVSFDTGVSDRCRQSRITSYNVCYTKLLRVKSKFEYKEASTFMA